jgi:hypothetical protein
MAIYMAQTIKEERLRWVLPIVRGEMRLVDVAKVCPRSKRSLERWVAVYSANSKRTSKRFKINWTGNWKDDESKMLSEVVIS